MKRQEFTRGDHLVSPRLTYDHHGLYAGNGRVIHYSGFTSSGGQGTVEICTLTEFCDGQPCHIQQHTRRRFMRDESVRRAFHRIGEARYNLLFQNCEHFVNWAIQGEASSSQVTAKACLAIGAVGAVIEGNFAAFAFRVTEREAEKPGGVPFLTNPRKRALAIQGTGLLFSLIGALTT